MRYLTATAVGTRLKILDAGSQAIPASERGEAAPEQIGQALREAIAKTKPRRGTVLVGLGRNDVELMNLTLPPARMPSCPNWSGTASFADRRNWARTLRLTSSR